MTNKDNAEPYPKCASLKIDAEKENALTTLVLTESSGTGKHFGWVNPTQPSTSKPGSTYHKNNGSWRRRMAIHYYHFGGEDTIEEPFD